MNRNLSKIIFATLAVVLISSCKSCNWFNDNPDVSDIDVKLKVLRLEKDYDGLNRNYDSAYRELENNYGDFLPFFLKQIAIVISPTDTFIHRDTFLRYVNDPYLKFLRHTARKKFSDISKIENDLVEAFRYYKYYYPKDSLPTIVTFVDGPPYGFTYDIQYLAIGLDGYFGEKFPAYAQRPEPIPQYQLRKFRPEYIVPNTINAWVSGLYDFDMQSNKLIDAMIYKGKVYYAMKKLLPETSDSLIFGYPDSTLTWLNTNEHEVWLFFIKNDLVYATDPLVYSKYINDAPGTSGMPPQAPGNIGSWVGYKIVEQYMKRNENVTLPQLMQEKDAQKILTLSRYKP